MQPEKLIALVIERHADGGPDAVAVDELDIVAADFASTLISRSPVKLDAAVTENGCISEVGLRLDQPAVLVKNARESHTQGKLPRGVALEVRLPDDFTVDLDVHGTSLRMNEVESDMRRHRKGFNGYVVGRPQRSDESVGPGSRFGMNVTTHSSAIQTRIDWHIHADFTLRTLPSDQSAQFELVGTC